MPCASRISTTRWAWQCSAKALVTGPTRLAPLSECKTLSEKDELFDAKKKANSVAREITGFRECGKSALVERLLDDRVGGCGFWQE